MTKSQAIFDFFNKFGLDAYPKTSVPEDLKMPYLTYENNIGNTGDEISIAVQIWYHTDSESILNAKESEIAESIGMGGKMISCDDGGIWIKRGSPWSIPLVYNGDNSIKGRTLNITIEFI